MTPEELAEAVGSIPILFWICLNPGHGLVTWADGVATCRDCGLTSEMTEVWAGEIREHERAEVAKRFRDRADQYEQARQADGLTLGQIWDGTTQAMTLRHHADWIEGKADAP